MFNNSVNPSLIKSVNISTGVGTKDPNLLKMLPSIDIHLRQIFFSTLTALVTGVYLMFSFLVFTVYSAIDAWFCSLPPLQFRRKRPCLLNWLLIGISFWICSISGYIGPQKLQVKIVSLLSLSIENKDCIYNVFRMYISCRMLLWTVTLTTHH